MTMTRPLRRTTLHLSQIFLTLGFTFTIKRSLLQLLLVPVNDPTSSEVIWTQLHDHTIFRKDADVVLSHLPADVREDFVSIGELDAEHRIR